MKNRNISLTNILSAVNKAMKAVGEECLHSKYRKLKQPDDHYSYGLCYPASEAVKSLAEEFTDALLKPCVGNVKGNTHWWLEDKKTGKRKDPTSKQFKNKNLREKFYAVGRGSGFLTKTPSKRAQPLILYARKLLLENSG